MFRAFERKLYIAFGLHWFCPSLNFSQQKCLLYSGPEARPCHRECGARLDVAPALKVSAATYFCWLHGEPKWKSRCPEAAYVCVPHACPAGGEILPRRLGGALGGEQLRGSSRPPIVS